MRRIIASSLALAVVAVVAVGVSLASGDGPAGGLAAADRDAQVHVIRVHRVPGESTSLDVDQSGDLSMGDKIVENGTFYRGTRNVGFDGVECTFVRAESWYQCVATNVFAGGSTTVQFLADFSVSTPGHFAITGGTGAFRGASGEVTYVGQPNGEADVTMRFTTQP